MNEQAISGEQGITRVNDILHLQAMKATYCDRRHRYRALDAHGQDEAQTVHGVRYALRTLP